MGDAGLRPVARGWMMSGGDLDDHETTRAIIDTIQPRLEAIDGYLGLIMALDREARVLRGVSMWTTEEARQASSREVFHVIGAVQALTSVDFTGPWGYEVAYSAFRPPVARVAPTVDVPSLTVRIARIQAQGAIDPGVVALLHEQFDSTVSPSPGCAGALALIDRDRPALIAATFWADADAEVGSRGMSQDMIADMAAVVPCESVTIGTYELVVSDPMTQLIN